MATAADERAKTVFQFLSRSLGLALLAAALVFAVLDITRSITASALVVTPFFRTFVDMAPQMAVNLEASLRGVHPVLWDPVGLFVLSLPTWLILWFLAMLFLWAGQKSRERFGRFASH